MKKTQETVLKTVLGLAVITTLVVGGFYYGTSDKESEKNVVAATEAQKLIEKDIEGNYPGTPREVLKLYLRITQCLYNETVKEEEFRALSDQLRLLFDEELLEMNQKAVFLENLSSDVMEFQNNGERITGYDIGTGGGRESSVIDNESYATLNTKIMIQQTGSEKGFTKSTEQFLFRQNEKGQWKIAHWKLADAESP